MMNTRTNGYERVIPATAVEKIYTEEYNKNLWESRLKRDKAVSSIPEWEQLRKLASQIREFDLSNLDYYLEQFEKKATENGAVVHWAVDAEEHNQIMYNLLHEREIKEVVKINSLLLRECKTVNYLQDRGIKVTETDMGICIQRLEHDPMTHVTVPIIKQSVEEIATFLSERVGSDPEERDPHILTEIIRKNMRLRFLSAGAGLSTPNFAVAESGTLAYFTNEGNVELGAILPPVHIVSVGIDKILSRVEDLAVFARIFARSALGRPATQYASHYMSPEEGKELHIILVDDGRSKRLSTPEFRGILKCIHCGACLNTCPVYRRMEKVLPYGAPIFRVLTPRFDLKENSELPFKSTLCGSCSAICPVGIDIAGQILQWRKELVKSGYFPAGRKTVLGAAGKLISHPSLYRTIEDLADKVLPVIPDFIAKNRFGPWMLSKNRPNTNTANSSYTFRDWYIKNRKEKKDE